MILSGKARLAGVLGWPISHSLSPRLHGYWLQHYGIDGAYLPLGAPSAALERVVRALCETPARRYGLYSRKGCLLPGADADILLVDMDVRETLSNDAIVSKCGWDAL